MRRIQLVEGDVWGHRKDISEYFVIKPSVFEKIKEMKLEGKMTEEIKVKVSRESKLSPQMVAYVMDKDNPD
jgi:ribosomal protein S19